MICQCWKLFISWMLSTTSLLARSLVNVRIVSSFWNRIVEELKFVVKNWYFFNLFENIETFDELVLNNILFWRIVEWWTLYIRKTEVYAIIENLIILPIRGLLISAALRYERIPYKVRDRIPLLPFFFLSSNNAIKLRFKLIKNISYRGRIFVN